LEVRAKAQPIPDYDGSALSGALDFRLSRKGPGRHRERFLHVKFVAPERRLNAPRAWRPLGTILKPSTDHRRLGLVELSRILYWNSEIPIADVRAQVIVALLQLRLVSHETFTKALISYLRGFRSGVTVDAAATVATNLVSRWSFPESHRAFRKYIASSLNRAKEEDPGLQYREKPVSAEALYRMIRDAESAVEFDREPKDDEVTSKAATQFHSIRDGGADVEDAASILGVCASYVYKLIKQGRIQTTTSNGIFRIPVRELVRLGKSITARKERRAVVSSLNRKGVKLGTARKAAYRKTGPCPRI
jgi:hypothetical protein